MNWQHRQRRVTQWLVLIFLAIALILFFLLLVTGPTNEGPAAYLPTLPSDISSPHTDPSSETGLSEEALAALPAPLASLNFPARAASFPNDWPHELRYPDSFELVDARSGVLPGSNAEGWIAQLKYRGKPNIAVDLLASFFASHGWQIADQHEFETGGFLVLIEPQNGAGRGNYLVDSDPRNPGTALVLVSIFP